MDCLEGLKLLSDNSIDLVVTSPPYNMRTRIRNGEYTTREKSEHFSKKYEHFSDDLTIEEYYDFHKSVLTELLRVSKCVLWNYQIVLVHNTMHICNDTSPLCIKTSLFYAQQASNQHFKHKTPNHTQHIKFARPHSI